MAFISENRKGCKALFVVIVLVLSIFLVRIPNGHYGSAYSTSVGNWIVTGTEVNQSQSILLNGDLTVEAGGSLTLRNDSLAINVQSDGEYGIFVEPGGSLYIYNSTIDSEDQIHRFTFLANGSNFAMEGSILQDAGRCAIQNGSAPTCQNDYLYNGSQGLLIGTNNALIKQNTISNSGIALTLSGTGGVVTDNSISSIDYSSIVLAYHLNSGDDSKWYFSNDTVSGNIIHQNVLSTTSMLLLDGSGGNLIQNNTFTATQTEGGPTLFAIGDSCCNAGWQNRILNNSITATGGMALGYGASSDVIADNSITFCEVGIFVNSAGSNDVFENNTLHAGLAAVSNGHGCGGQGILLHGGRQLVIAGNTFTTDNTPLTKQGNFFFAAEGAVELVQLDDSYFLNNNITFTGQASPSLYVMDSSDNTFAGNRLAKTATQTLPQSSIFLFLSDNNTIYHNYSNSSSPYSIIVDRSNENSVYQNDFVGNGQSAYDGGAKNSWTFQGVGNYWGGICEAPYEVWPNGTDNHPLTSPLNFTPVQVPVLAPATIPPLPNFVGLLLTISNDTTIAGESATYMNGGINVESGGHLTIDKCNFIFSPSGSFDINVAAGGSLSIIDSNITVWTGGLSEGLGASVVLYKSDIIITGALNGVGPSHAAFPFGLSESSLTINSSKIQAVPGTVPQGGGFIIDSETGGSRVTIIHSALSGGASDGDYLGTIVLKGNNETLVMIGSTLENCASGINFGGNTTAIIENDAFVGMTNIENVPSVNSVFKGNLIEDAGGIPSNEPGVTIENNTVLGFDIFYQPQPISTNTCPSFTSTSSSTSSSSSNKASSTTSSSVVTKIIPSTSISSSISSSVTTKPVSITSSYGTATSKGGGVPEFAYFIGIIVVLMVIIAGAYLFLRRRSVT